MTFILLLLNIARSFSNLVVSFWKQRNKLYLSKECRYINLKLEKSSLANAWFRVVQFNTLHQDILKSSSLVGSESLLLKQ